VTSPALSCIGRRRLADAAVLAGPLPAVEPGADDGAPRIQYVTRNNVTKRNNC